MALLVVLGATAEKVMESVAGTVGAEVESWEAAASSHREVRAGAAAEVDSVANAAAGSWGERRAATRVAVAKGRRRLHRLF